MTRPRRVSDATVATIRTVTPAAWTALLADIIHRVTGADITPANIAALIAVYAPVLAAVYRAGRLAADRWPILGWIIFGHPAAPNYEPPLAGLHFGRPRVR